MTKIICSAIEHDYAAVVLKSHLSLNKFIGEIIFSQNNYFRI